MAKAKKIKPIPIPSLNDYVLSISNIIGYDTYNNCLKLKNGYAVAISIPGIDIMNFKSVDKEFVYGAFGQATQLTDCACKYVILSDKSDYHTQIEFLNARLKRQSHPYRRYLLERQIEWLKSYEKAQSDRLSYGVFFDQDKISVKENALKFINQMQTGKSVPALCQLEDYKRIFQILLRGGTL